MNIYAIIYLSLVLVGIGSEIEKHGKPKTGNHNIFISLFAQSIILFLLWKGGFFE